MRRSALRNYLRALAAAAAIAPVVAGCGGPCGDVPDTNQIDFTPIDGGPPPGTMLTPDQCKSFCSLTAENCSVENTDGGDAVACVTQLRCVGGRRPAGLAEALPHGDGDVGRFFARASHLEAASVIAFRRLAAELERHRAPARLIDAARRSAADERRHARAMTALARRFRAEPAAVVVAPVEERSLYEFAVENAVEGCVGETWGAVLALWQENAAHDPEVRAAMARIAEDEIAHADLAWAISRWLEPFLDENERARVVEARRAAVEEISASIDQTPARSLILDAGLPVPERARALFEPLREKLWS